MKTLLHAVAALAVLGVSACSTPPVMTAEDLDGAIVCDSQYMDGIEKAGEKKHTKVQWVNCPKAKVTVVKS